MEAERITAFCFQASYAVALALELLQLLWRHRAARWVAAGFGAAGLLAHTVFLAVHRPSLASQAGSLLFLAWILVVFYLYGSLHHRRVAWGVFVLPLVLALVVLAGDGRGAGSADVPLLTALRGERFWSTVHGGLLLLAAVGVSVACVASLMYLFQAHRLRAKVPPGQGLRLLSLERLEAMNRRAVTWAFPLLTAGVLVGLVLMWQRAEQLHGWTDPKVVGAAVLWVVFAILLYLRYGYRLRGRRVALLTIVAFALLLFTLASAHTSVQGAGP